jgi:hypothetical protein
MNSLCWILKEYTSCQKAGVWMVLKTLWQGGRNEFLPYRQNVTYTMPALVVAPPKFKSVLVLLTL